MTYRKSLCLNMIVKNELANLERCFRAIVDHITYWVIGDTGSHDGTENLIQSFFGQRNVPGELHSFTFENFEQARNEALQRAYASPHAYDYLLLADADMELVIEDEEFRTKLDAPGYRVIQRADGDFVYWNTRLVQRSVGARYRGVTHEYLDVPGRVEDLKGVWYKITLAAPTASTSSNATSDCSLRRSRMSRITNVTGSIWRNPIVTRARRQKRRTRMPNA